MSKSVTLQLPDDVAAIIAQAQAATGEDLADFLTIAGRERAEALSSNRFFGRRAKPFDRAAFLAVLNREGGELPRAGDELPEGYVRTR